MFILQLIIILAAAKLAGHISARLGQPTVLGQLLAGILIGPAVFGWVENSDILKELSTIGVILLMFIAGLETDVREFKRNAKAASYVGFGGVIIPFAGGYASGVWLGLGTFESMFFGLVLTATSVSITVQVLREMGKLKSKEGVAILGAAVLDDILVIVMLAFLMSFMGSDVNVGLVLLKKFVFFAAAIVLVWKVLPWVMNRLAQFKIPQAPLGAALLLCLVLAYFAELTGVAAIIGAYLAGIAVGLTSYGHSVMEKTESVGYALFVPVFFISIGFHARFDGVGEYVWLLVPLCLLAVLTKLVGSGLGARLAGYDWRSSIAVGSGMVSRGEVAVILAALGLESGLLDPPLFTVLIILILATTIAAPPLLKLTFSGKKTETAAVNKDGVPMNL
ncbi:cation:proton antiporter [Paenibacillus alkalitolerans]|uniref:cation:proton antiporter n=1 Tax=Paenibacillus alkalitolerans TaxID=2799335 RepID=UPI0018F3D5DA|nr:cation:proton antiporter [Paenibacillus alkalitolerans]